MSQAARFNVLLIIAVGLLCCSADEVEAPHPFLVLLPQEGDAGSWKPEDEPQHVEGEDLFLLINGGAEIYHEYGFTQAAVQSYIDDQDRSLTLEIYEMSDPSAAYGIYSFKRGAAGDSLDLGDEATLQDYYLNVWKGNVLITVIGFDTEKETREGLEALARSVVGKVASTASRPSLVTLLPQEGLNTASVKYLKGGQALFNAHEFARGNIFGVREGVVAEVDGNTVFLFAYENEGEATEWLGKAWEKLSTEDGYQTVVVEGDEFSAVDSEGMQLRAAAAGRYILLAVGDNATATLAMLRAREQFSNDNS
jgi:hypothetical protein